MGFLGPQGHPWRPKGSCDLFPSAIQHFMFKDVSDRLHLCDFQVFILVNIPYMEHLGMSTDAVCVIC